MKIKKNWFDAEHIYDHDEEGHEYSQSLLWYPKLRTATDEERAAYTFGFDGIHWHGLDKDISFESFAYDDTEPTPLQRFFHNLMIGIIEQFSILFVRHIHIYYKQSFVLFHSYGCSVDNVSNNQFVDICNPFHFIRIIAHNTQIVND